MALQKEIENPKSGHIDEYWKITNLSIDAVTGEIRIVLGGYKDKEAREENKGPDVFKEIAVPVLDILTKKQYEALFGSLYERISDPIEQNALDDTGEPIKVDINEFTGAIEI